MTRAAVPVRTVDPAALLSTPDRFLPVWTGAAMAAVRYDHLGGVAADRRPAVSSPALRTRLFSSGSGACTDG